jgi:hypothetical protein
MAAARQHRRPARSPAPALHLNYRDDAGHACREQRQRLQGSRQQRCQNLRSCPGSGRDVPDNATFRERCRTRPSDGGLEAHERVQSHWHSRLPTSHGNRPFRSSGAKTYAIASSLLDTRTINGYPQHMDAREERRQRFQYKQQIIKRLRLATTRLHEAEQERIWAIVLARDAGVSIRQIATATGLSRSRIHLDMTSWLTETFWAVSSRRRLVSWTSTAGLSTWKCCKSSRIPPSCRRCAA